MCGFTGFCNLKRKITSKDIIYNMNKCISNRGPDENGYYEFKHLSKDEYYIQYDDLGENQVFVYKDSSSYYPSSVINPDTGKSDIITTLNSF